MPTGQLHQCSLTVLRTTHMFIYLSPQHGNTCKQTGVIVTGSQNSDHTMTHAMDGGSPWNLQAVEPRDRWAFSPDSSHPPPPPPQESSVSLSPRGGPPYPEYNLRDSSLIHLLKIKQAHLEYRRAWVSCVCSYTGVYGLWTERLWTLGTCVLASLDQAGTLQIAGRGGEAKQRGETSQQNGDERIRKNPETCSSTQTDS